MIVTSKSFLSRIVFIVLAMTFCALRPQEADKKPMNYYQAIGLNNYVELLNEARDKAEATTNIQRLRERQEQMRRDIITYQQFGRTDLKELSEKEKADLEKRIDFLKKKEEVEKEISIEEEDISVFPDEPRKIKLKNDLAAINQQIYQEQQPIIDAFLGPIIKEACQKAREENKEELDEAQEKLEASEDFERRRLLEVVTNLRKKSQLIQVACTVLSDPTQRRAYDARILKAEERIKKGVSKDAAYFDLVQANVQDAMPDKKVLLNQIVGDLLSQLDIPGPAAKIFNQNLEVRSLKFLPMPQGADVKYGLGFTGLMALNKFEVRLSIYLIQDIYGDFKFTYIVELPEQYKVTDLFPSLKMFDSFKFPKAKFIIANFNGSDNDGFYFQKGFNFGAVWDIFSGPFAVLNELKSKAKGLDSLVFENKPVTLSGVIPLNPLKSEFNATLPLRIGLDLRKVSAIPKTISDVLNRITTNDITLDVAPVSALLVKDQKGAQVAVERRLPIKVGEAASDDTFKAKEVASYSLGFKIVGEWGIRLELSTQPNPMEINSRVVLIPISSKHPQGMITASLLLKNMLELKWLAIGNAALSFDFDGALIAAAAAVGIPFTGIGIRGEIDLGLEGETRAKFKTAGGFRVSASEVPLDVVLDLTAENIRLANIVHYASELAQKAKLVSQPVSLERIPVMTLHKAWGYCAFKDTTIAGVPYKAGIALQLETEFFKHKAGFKIHMDDKYKLSGWGYMPAVDWQIKGQRVVKLTGLSPDKGPRLAFSFDPADPYKGSYAIESKLVIPALDIDSKVFFDWSGTTLNAEIENTKMGFTTMFGIRMNTAEGMEPAVYERMRIRMNEQLEKIEDKGWKKSIAKSIEKSDQLAHEGRYKDAIITLQILQKELDQKLNSVVGAIPVGIRQGYDAMKQFRDKLIKAEGLKNTLEVYIATIKRISKNQVLPGIWLNATSVYDRASKNLAKISFEDMKNDAETRAKQDLKTLGTQDLSPQELEKYIPLKFVVASEKQRIELDQIIKQFNEAINLFKEAVPKADLKKVEQEVNKQVAVQKKELRFEQLFPMSQQFAGLLGRWGASRQVQYPEIVDPWGMAQKISVNFGFRGDFGKYLNENAVQTLAKMRDNALKKLDELNKKVAQFAITSEDATKAEIQRVQEAIAVLSSDIAKMEKECVTKPLYRQVGCRSSIAGAKAQLLVKKGYLNMLLQPGKHVVKGVTRAAADVTKAITQNRAVRMATEKILAAATAGMDMIAKGLTMINVTQVRGQYDWADMVAGKFPKLVLLVARIELPEEFMMPPMDIILQDLQFDFKNIAGSTNKIVQAIMTAFIEGQQNKYLRYAIDLAE